MANYYRYCLNNVGKADFPFLQTHSLFQIEQLTLKLASIALSQIEVLISTKEQKETSYVKIHK